MIDWGTVAPAGRSQLGEMAKPLTGAASMARLGT
jgi:hypothetical protein